MTLEYVTVHGQQYPVDFDYCDEHGTSVETKAPCPECADEADWKYTQLCEAGYPGVLECQNCDAQVRLETMK